MTAVTNPNVYINDEIVEYKPNSIKFHDGEGEYTIRTKTTGGNNRKTIATANVETMRSMFSITLYAETTPIDLVRTWKRSANGVSIDINQGDWSRSFAGARIIGNPEFNLGTEGEFEVTFEGDTAV